MWNIIEYNQIARGEGVRLFTACGIFEGVYRGSEAVDESQPEQWVVLSDVTFSPPGAARPKREQIHVSDANVQLSQIIALDLDNG